MPKICILMCSVTWCAHQSDGSRPPVFIKFMTWWRHQMGTFSALLAICAGNLLVSSEFPAQRPVTRSFDVFFDLHLNKRLSKQWWGWWFETPSRPSWRHWNEYGITDRLFEFAVVGRNYLIFITVRCLGNRSHLWNVNGDVYDKPPKTTTNAIN